MNNVKTLFGFPVWSCIVEPSCYDKQNIIDVINRNYDKQPDRTNNFNQTFWQNKTMHHAYKDELNDNFECPNFNKLKLLYAEKINLFKQECGLEGTCYTDIINYTVINNDQEMQPHDHFNVNADIGFAATHYISIDSKTHSPITFINNSPLTQLLRASNLNNMINQENNIFGYLNSFYDYYPKEDELIIFPSCLLHGVKSSHNVSSKNRICIALNINVSAEPPQYYDI